MSLPESYAAARLVTEGTELSQIIARACQLSLVGKQHLYDVVGTLLE